MQVFKMNDGCAPKPGPGFALLALVQGTLIFTITLIAIPMPFIGREYHLTTSALIVLQIAYGLPYSGLLLLGGDLADRYGATRLIHIGLWLFGLASLGAGLASGFYTLVIMRALQGMAAALIAPAAMAHVTLLYPGRIEFDRAMAQWGGVSVLGAALGTVLSGIVITWFSWRWMFLFPCLVSGMALMLLKAMLPCVSRTVTNRRLDLCGAGLALLAFCSLGYGLAMGSETGWDTPAIITVLIIGSASLACFAWYERRTISPLLAPDFLSDKTRLAGAIGIFIAAASMGLVTFVITLYLQRGPGWSPLSTTVAMVPYLLVLLAGNVISSRLVMRIGAWGSMVMGMLLSAIGLWLLTGFGADYAFEILPGLLLLPAGTSLIFAASAVMMTHGVAPERIGVAAGVMNTTMELGPTAGLAGLLSLTSLRTELEAGWSLAFLAAAAIAGIMTILLGSGIRASRHSL